MSKLIVEVVKIIEVKNHPNADRLDICRVKGWDVVTGREQFKQDELAVYFPPDSILPQKLAEDRLDIAKYCTPLITDKTKSRVRATRLRGHQSFGVLMKIDTAWGDDNNWKEGTDVKEHFKIEKWDPDVYCSSHGICDASTKTLRGDMAPVVPRFHKYCSPENIRNFPNILQNGEEVVFTEKIHGTNCRVGLVMNNDGMWEQMCGSHNVRRYQYSQDRMTIQWSRIKNHVENIIRKIGFRFMFAGKTYLIKKISRSTPWWKFWKRDFTLSLIEDPSTAEESIYWKPLKDQSVLNLLFDIRDNLKWQEPITGVIVYSEIFGHGIQDMHYDSKIAYRVFDIAVNGKYLDYDDKVELCVKHGVPMVPTLYRGQFSWDIMEKFTCGDTTICDLDTLNCFKGREGIVITPVKERYDRTGRVIFKSISPDYLARKEATDSH